MPGGDRTGPMGAGPMTGRGDGICAGCDVPGYMNPAIGRGFGGGRDRGFGRGFRGGGQGRRHRYYATGLPGWARGYDYPYPRSAVAPVDSGTVMNAEAIQAEELTYLREQARYFKGVLDHIERRVSELQPQTKRSSKGQKKKNK